MPKVDIFHPASYHEVKSVRIRYQKSLWFRLLADSFCLMGDRGYRGLEYVHVCEDKLEKSVRQVIEAVYSQIKLLTELADGGILQLYLLTFRVIL
jgi:hypothetical protein